jgi:hypothetical protein
MTDCQTCRRPTDLFLCQSCCQELDGLLTALPWLLTQLEITVTRQDKLTIGDVGHYVTEWIADV